MKSENSIAAQIKCTSYSRIHFHQSQCIHISNLEFIGCRRSLVSLIKQLLIADTKFEGQENGGTALEMVETAAQIVNSTFVSNRIGSSRKYCRDIFDHDQYDYCRSEYDSAGGAIIATNSTINISQSRFEDYMYTHSTDYIGSFGLSEGGVMSFYCSTVKIETSKFLNNSGTTLGGVLSSYRSTVMIEASKFHNSSATESGGIIFASSSNITIKASEFYNNNAGYRGGVLFSEHGSIITVEAIKCHKNSATNGGVLNSENSSVTIRMSEFHNNSATHQGGVLDSHISNITLDTTKSNNNIATDWGGVLYSWGGSTIKIGGSNFTNNHSPTGAVIYGTGSSKVQYHNLLLFDNNQADRYAMIYLSDSEFIGDISGNAIFISNLGSLMVFNSNITFTGYAIFMNNQPSQTASGDFQEGGAITLFQSNVLLMGNAILNTTMLKMVEQYILQRANSM